jgi:hypothetical protein
MNPHYNHDCLSLFQIATDGPVFFLLFTGDLFPMNWLRHFSRNRAPLAPQAFLRSGWRRSVVRGRFLRTLALLITAGLVTLLLWLPRWGSWLIIQEPLQTADAIVVLGGNLPFRSQVAASLYQQGWAKQVWITAPEGAAETEAIKNLGLSSVPQEELSRRVLEQFGVPPLAIRTLSAHVGNTAARLRPWGMSRTKAFTRTSWLPGPLRYVLS